MKGNQQTTLRSIATELGISVSTVSRVLSGKARQYRISEKTERLIREEADQLGFTPNQIASSLRLRRTRSIGLIIPDISNTFFASVARFVEIEAREHGYSIILCDTQENPEIEMESIRLLQGRNVDGLIISPVGQIGGYLAGLRARGLPVVLLDRYFPGMDLPFVTSDNYKGAFDATEYLIGMGHRRIACITGLPDASTNMDRVAGFRDALARHGVATIESWIAGNEFSEHNGYIQTRMLLESNPRPTAIFSLGNLPTFGAMRAIAEAGLAIPEDVSLMSFDDHYYSPFLATPLTAVAQQMEEIGKVAVTLLYHQLDGKPEPGTGGISLATRLNIRSSVTEWKATKGNITS